MPRKISKLAMREQPLNWPRAFVCGVVGASLMMGFVDIFYMLGITPFSYEQYIGSLLRSSTTGHHNWTLGVVANWILGGLFGFVYAFFFEGVFKAASGRLGALLGLGHAFLAMAAFFPFFNILHEQVGTGLYPRFGLLGSSLGGPTPILLLIGTILFGATLGTFYGPVRSRRARAREYEPGATGVPVELGGVTPDQDPADRVAV